MASVQVRILQSGRTDAYGLPLIPGSVVTVDRDYAVSLVSAGFSSWMNPADAYDGETNFRKPSETYDLFQSGIPFWLPPGDGGANGLNFTGTRGVFTLSAEAPMASAYLALASGGYCYLPAGSGGLATGGWYWCVMTDGTNGEIFANTYSGTGQPAFISSPTALPNLTTGRITQLTTEISGPSFTMPGGCMGPNGIMVTKCKHMTTSSAGTKTIRQKIGSTNIISWPVTNTWNNQLFQATRQNMGVINRQIGNRSASVLSSWDCGASASALSGDVTTVDTSIDQTVTFSGQVSVNTDSILLIPMQFIVQYGP